MSADQLLEALRALRQTHRDADYWPRLCACLAALCRAGGAVVVQQRPQDSWTPVASVPVDPPWVTSIPSWIQALEGRAQSQGHAYQPDEKHGFVCAVRLLDPVCPTLVILLIPATERAHLNELMLRAQLVADLPRNTTEFSGQILPATPNTDENDFMGLLDVVAKVMQESSFGAAGLTLVNGVVTQGQLGEVAWGWRGESGYVKLQAVSHLDRFERNMDNVSLLELAMEESIDQGQDIALPPPDQNAAICLAHQRLQRTVGMSYIVTLHLSLADSEEKAALTLMRSNQPFTASEINAISVAMHLLLPWLALSRRDSMPWWERYRDQARSRFRDWMSPERPVKKVLIGLASLVFLFLLFGVWPHRIEAGAELVTDSTQIISSPFDGYLATVHVTLGETVRQDQPLATLDVRDLTLQIADFQSEWARFVVEADRARAQSQAADTQIALARADQAKAKLDRAVFQKRQSTLVAPFEGVVVEGERKELTGMPVRQGDQVFKLARIEGLYAQLSVSERDVSYIVSQARGRIRLLSAPDQPIPFEVDTLVPAAQARGDAGNQFLLKVKLLQAPAAWWRPGMSGLALIEAGDRNILWLLTHRIVEAIRLRLWW